MLMRAVVKLSDSAHKMQTVQVQGLGKVVLDNIEHWEPYGLTSRPHAEAEALIGCIGGSLSHGVAINIADRRYRLQNLAEGEVALYDDLGNMVKLGRSQVTVEAVSHLEASAPTAKITATTTHIGDVTIEGNLVVTGLIIGQGGMAISGGSGASVNGNLVITGGDVDADGISLKGHTHSDPQGGTVGPAQ